MASAGLPTTPRDEHEVESVVPGALFRSLEREMMIEWLIIAALTAFTIFLYWKACRWR